MIATNKSRRPLLPLVLLGAIAVVVSCTARQPAKRTETPDSSPAAAVDAASTRMAASQGVLPMNSATHGIVITCTAFGDGQPIPIKFTADGEDVSPPLAWKEMPSGTKQWALICEDPDAPTTEPWVHWVLYCVPAATHSLPEGVKTSAQLSEPKGARQGKNSWPSGRTVGYRGPAPPKGHGVHHYHFKLYALDSDLKLGAGLTKSEVMKAMDGHILGVGELIGTYERK